ncbi:MAG: hypothetical protein J3Q66DRAFT_418623 [Benniella sp.]|nr:MAG: hypothetical protein J3Q66DRAFT_418623 [Benniella sp.]
MITATATTSIDIDLDLSPSLDTDGDPAHLNPPTSDPCNVSMEELPQVDLPLAAARDHETVEYKSLGRMDRICPHCQAQLWLEERLVASSSLNPKFSICCGQGAVRLTPLSVPPDGLRELFEGRQLKTLSGIFLTDRFMKNLQLHPTWHREMLAGSC